MSRGRIQPKVEIQRRLVFGVDERCTYCNGKGHRIGRKELCGACSGTGITQRREPNGRTSPVLGVSEREGEGGSPKPAPAEEPAQAGGD